MDTLTDGVVAERGGGRDEGFTLIELLIVIVILGILSVVVVISVSGITNRGKTSACASDERALRTAAENYFAQINAYPADEATMVTAGFLSEVSSLHDLVGAGTTYTITSTPAGGCPAVGA